MKKLILFVFITCMLQACIVTKHQSSIAGIFIGNTSSYSSFSPSGKMSIHLKPDGKFALNWLDVDYSGIWQISGKNQILLQFDKITDISILLRSGTLSGEDKIVYFINKNKIKVNGDVLKRIN